jgi:hypothetical protein
MQAAGAHLSGKPFGALALQKCGRGNPANLLMDFIDPLLFAREPLQDFPNLAILRHLMQRQRICLNAFHRPHLDNSGFTDE